MYYELINCTSIDSYARTAMQKGQTHNITVMPKGRIINSYLLTTQIVYIHIMGTVISHRLTSYAFYKTIS